MSCHAPRLASLAISCAVAAPAFAQDNALTSAVDAFGERAGIEQSGLYTESQVRGFDLNDSGAYRIDEAYFGRAAAMDDTVLSGVGVRVGVNAARLDYPAPSGVVSYRLREAGPRNEVRVGAGVRDFGTRVIQADGSLRSGSFSLAGGLLSRPRQVHPQGYRGVGLNLGGVAAWQLAPERRLRAFASLYRRHYDGDYAVSPTGAAMPPPLRPLHQYSPDWASTVGLSSNTGLLFDGRYGGFDIDLSAFRSTFDIDRNDFTLISADAAGNATATTLRTPRREKHATSAEARIARSFATGAFGHRATLSLRGARMRNEFTSSQAIALGAFHLSGDPPEVAEAAWSGRRGEDRTEQLTASAGYALTWHDRLQLRFGLHRVRYDKASQALSGNRTRRVGLSTHHNASAVYNLSDRTALFGSWVTGLEESGAAPGSASNRDEVLPPGEAEQKELGLRHALTPQLTVIGALFDVSKPSQGLRQDGSFGLTGEVRHRGIEASIAGKLNERTHVVAGLVRFQSQVSGPLVDAGLVGSHGVGVAQTVAAASIEYRLRDDWSLDAGLSHTGERWANTANTLKAPALTILSLGTRRRFDLGRHPAELRIVASNLTGEQGYTVARSGLLSPVPPRTIRAVLTVGFGAKD